MSFLKREGELSENWKQCLAVSQQLGDGHWAAWRTDRSLGRAAIHLSQRTTCLHTG